MAGVPSAPSNCFDAMLNGCSVAYQRPLSFHHRASCTQCGLIGRGTYRFGSTESRISISSKQGGFFGLPGNERIHSLLGMRVRRPLQCQALLCSSQYQQPHNHRSPAPSMDSVKPLVPVLKKEAVFESPPIAEVNLKPLVSLVGANGYVRRAIVTSVVSRVLGRFLLSAFLLAGLFIQPLPCLRASVHAAPPPTDIGFTSEQGFYNTLFEKLQQKDKELGTSEKESGLERLLKDQVYKLHKRLKERQDRFDAARRKFEESVKSRDEEMGISPQEEAIPADLDQSPRSAADGIIEEGASSHEKDPSMPMGLEEKARVVNDLTGTLWAVWEHKYLPDAVDVELDKPPVNEPMKKLLEDLRLEKDSKRQLSEIVDNMIKDDIEAERSMEGSRYGNVNFAPSLKRWKEEKKSEVKRFLQANPEMGQRFIAQEQERILLFRDRVMAGTWYNEKRKEWVISSETLGYAVDKELVQSARIRHDRRVIYVKLKGDDRVFFSDLEAYDLNFRNFGGFEALYLKLLSSGVSTSVEVMWIPLSQWETIRIFMVPFKVLFAAIRGFWESGAVTPMVVVYFRGFGSVMEELSGRFLFPILDKLPKPVQIFMGLQLPDNAPIQSTRVLLEVKKYVQKRMEERFGQGEGSLAWWLSLPLKCFLLWIPFAYVSGVVGKVVGWLFGPREEMNEVEWKEKKGKEIMKKLKGNTPRALEDPIRKAFDQMKRIKEPEIRLNDFAGLDTVKEEINEIVTFLRDPSLFMEMGARPPRGVLIVGQPGTGKTSLAMAIAAEARVPLVELDGLELEGGAWVGQGASNVRELFKTARELAPLIIFMDDFDYFAGVRGDSGDTRKQDHESLINQLLVELDGFETQEGVVLLATSSRPGNIDEALRRPGRMDRTIVLPMPNKTERELMLRKAALETMDPELIDLVDWKEVAQKTQGMTPLQLKDLPRGLEASFVTWKYTDDEELFTIFKWLATFNKITPDWLGEAKWMKAWKSKLRDWLGLRVTKEDVDAAIFCLDPFNESRPGLEFAGPGYDWTREFKYPHAVWAAGRGLVGALLPCFDELQQIWLDQNSWEGIGFTRFRKRKEGGYQETGTLTRSYYEKKLVLCFGSTVAARLLLPFGHRNNLSKFEIKEAREIAASMVVQFGWGPDRSQAIYASPNERRTLSLGEELEVELEAKAAKLYNAAADRAAHMVEKNRGALEALLDHLLEFDAISSKDIARILQEQRAIFEEEPFRLVPHADDDDQVMEVYTNGTGPSMRVASAVS